jgi:hypothetical protein
VAREDVPSTQTPEYETDEEGNRVKRKPAGRSPKKAKDNETVAGENGDATKEEQPAAAKSKKRKSNKDEDAVGCL